MSGEIIALALALLIGVSLGALGSGGSIVTLPILVYVAGVAPKSAVGMSIAIVGGTSLAGSYFQWRSGNLIPRAALLFSAAGIPGAYLGSIGTHLVPSSVLMLLFAALMLVVGTLMFRGREDTEQPVLNCSPSRCLPAGFLVGLVTGFMGVGGGFLIVPALVWFAGLGARKAIGSSLGIIAINSAAGLAGQLRYAQWDWPMTARFVAFSLIGMAIGIPVAARAPERGLRKAFGVAVVTVAVAIGWRELGR